MFSVFQEEKEATIAAAKKTINSIKSKMSLADGTQTLVSAKSSIGSQSYFTNTTRSNDSVMSTSTSTLINVLDTHSESWEELDKWADNMKIENKEFELCFESGARRRRQSKETLDSLRKKLPPINDYCGSVNNDTTVVGTIAQRSKDEAVADAAAQGETPSDVEDSSWARDESRSKLRITFQALGWAVCGIFVGKFQLLYSMPNNI